MNLSFLEKIFNRSERELNDICEKLKLDKNVLKAFEENYKNASIDNYSVLGENHFGQEKDSNNDYDVNEIKTRIVNELVSETQVWKYDGKSNYYFEMPRLLEGEKYVDKLEVMNIPTSMRPMLTGNLMKVDINGDNGIYLLKMLKNSLEEVNPDKKKRLYNMFRQGLDLLDLDEIIYLMLSQNKNAMGYWLPRIVNEVDKEGFFKVPKTTIIKVPITVLQLTRLGYQNINRVTLDIVNEYCYKVFGLKEELKYFVKTGTYSAKYDFRNALVKEASEVRSLGEYLLFIHSQALEMAHYDTSVKNRPIIYGVSTTNEWVVREFIEDKEDNLTIYHGLPLHTEYRVFVDFDSKEVLGVHEYWDKDKMISSFMSTISGATNFIDVLKSRKDSIPNYEEELKSAYQTLLDAKHDLLTFKGNYEVLHNRYNENKSVVCEHLKSIISKRDLSGQWSIDVMQNGSEFYIIDMQEAVNSTYYKETVKEDLRKPNSECWVPDLGSEEAKRLLKKIKA